MSQAILIIGEDPAQIDFTALGAPPGMSAEKIMRGLTGSRDRLQAMGHKAEILLTKDIESLEKQVIEALRGQSYDIFVVGAGLRTLPPMAEKFERLMNVLHRQAPSSRLAFNSRPDDSDVAALRHL